MGKKLVIKGADFSENGFVYELVKREITTLYNTNGATVATGDSVQAADSVYYYEHTNGSLQKGSGFAGACSTAYNTTYIDVEDYTDAEIITTCNIEPYQGISGGAVMFFLDANKAIIGGLSTGASSHGCVNVGYSNTEITRSMKIPEGARYVVCTAVNTSTKKVPNFKLTLSKKVIG